MRKRKILGFVVLMFILASLIIFWKIKVIKYGDNTFIEWSDSDVSERVTDVISNEKIKIISSLDNDTEEVFISDLGISFKLVDSEDQEIKEFPRFFDLEQVLLYYIEDGQVFKKYFYNINKELSSSKDAYYEFTDTDVLLHKEIIGTKIDIDLLYDDYKSFLNKGISDIDLNSYIIQPTITTDYYSSVEKELKHLKEWGITYSNGSTLDFKDLISYIKISDNNIKIKKKKLSEFLMGYLPEKLSSYNTVGKSRQFKTTSSGKITLSTGTYGDIVNLESEVEYIISSFKKHKSESNRLPELSLDLPDDLPNTYVEVSISKQHLWYYVDGVLKMETDVVTGNKGKHDTPRGIYYISERIGGKYLTGDTYKTWVNQWMRLTNTGIGLHDAYWRSNFGGSIYTYNGSHGCVNLPKDFAKRIFNSVEWKTAVIIY